MKQKLAAMLAFGLLISCAQPDKNNLPAELDRSATLGGVDHDENGVRDDIDAYITGNYRREEQRRAALQSARAFSGALMVEPGDVIQAKVVNVEIARATHCLYSAFPSPSSEVSAARVGRELESLTTNTRQRLQAYLDFAKALDGTSWTTPKGDTCK